MLLLCREAVAPGRVGWGRRSREGSQGHDKGEVGKVNAPHGNAMLHHAGQYSSYFEMHSTALYDYNVTTVCVKY